MMGDEQKAAQIRKDGATPSSDRGPIVWLAPFLESRYTRMTAKPADPGTAKALEAQRADAQARAVQQLLDAAKRRNESTALVPVLAAQLAGGKFASVLQPGRGEDVLAPLPPDYWFHVMQQYRERRHQKRLKDGLRPKSWFSLDLEPPPSPGIPGQNNWLSIGPSVIRKGQADGRPGVSGRTSGIAIAPGGMRVYVATADGGVWRSDDGGSTWLSTMDDYDLDPTAYATTSLACGAIAIDPADPNRVYVGTGEADTNSIFSMRLTNALPTYRGVGPLRSDDGGATWVNELADTGSPSLMGSACFEMAVDPGDRENVVAATNIGLYRREPAGGNTYQWVRKRSGIHCSVVVARTGSTTTFFAAGWGDQVYASSDGSSWGTAGTGFPTGTTRIRLAVRDSDPSVLYAICADTNDYLLGVYRLDNAIGPWKTIAGTAVGMLSLGQGGQLTYDLAITIDPNNAGVIYLGGKSWGAGYPAAIFRAQVVAAGTSYQLSGTYIGSTAHADVHGLCFVPGSSNALFAVTDGGVFKSSNALATTPSFESCNVGLSTLCAEYIGQHPTEPAVLFAGLQDNGTARYTGEECWSNVNGGDGGYCIINWANPFTVLSYANGKVYRATDGGQDWQSWTPVTPNTFFWQSMTEPLVSTPPNTPGQSAADLVAFGTGSTLHISSDFGLTWISPITVNAGGTIYSMAFASATRLYLGTTTGGVVRFDLAGTVWVGTRIDNVAAGPLPIYGLVTDIEVDLADPSGLSVYLTFGGAGDWRHVWHFDGNAWTPRSGPSAGDPMSLLDVEHNALVVDPSNPATLFVGADVGVWKSSDGGGTWATMELGLPDAAVLDLQIHQPSRLLRAALYGRGVYQYELDQLNPDELVYIRDTTYDLGRGPMVSGLDDYATWPVAQTVNWESVNIKIDVPTTAGYQTPTPNIDFFTFVDRIVDGGGAVATLDPSQGTVTNRVYVEVHNRGITPVTNVSVMLLVTQPSVAWADLPSNYNLSVQTSTPISTSDWETVGIKGISMLRNGLPQVAEFALPSTMLPPPANLPGQGHHCLVAIAHGSGDPFSSTETQVALLAIADRKVAQKNLQIVEFIGTPPPAATGPGQWAAAYLFANEQIHDMELVVDLRGFPGRVGVVFPPALVDRKMLSQFKLDTSGLTARYAAEHGDAVAKAARAGRFSAEKTKAFLVDLKRIAGEPMVLLDEQPVAVFGNLTAAPNTSQALFLNVQAWPKAAIGDNYRFRVYTRNRKTQVVQGGNTYLVKVVSPAKES
jgi:hypothetical protein